MMKPKALPSHKECNTDRPRRSLVIMYILIGMIQFLYSCTDDTFIHIPSNSYISVSFNSAQTRLSPGDDVPGNGLDNIVYRLRILVFDENNGNNIVSNPGTGNVCYNIINTPLDIIRHPIPPGTYTLVFLANEAPETTSALEGISTFDGLKAIAYPASAFTSNVEIPMMQVVKGVEISADGNVGKAKLTQGTLTDINGKTRGANPLTGLYAANAETSMLILCLDRLAVRMNVLLQSEFAINDDFESLTLTNIPDVVPLFQASYTGTINRTTEIRTYTASEFADVTPLPTGMDWAKQLSRIVMPSNHVASKGDATVLTVKLKDGKYSPSHELAILDDNYNLPYNTWLDFTGTVKQPLEVNIGVADWSAILNSWQISGTRILNVSQTSANITDFNGTRISFYSTMPRVRVVSVTKNGIAMDINTAFNDLANPAHANGVYSTSRFSYNPLTGSGYMDVVVDGGNYDTVTDGTGTYVLTLSADDGNGGNVLQREITVNVSQYGIRFVRLPWVSTYWGIFYRDNEYGERIITGQAVTEDWGEWIATVDDNVDWIVLSSTPSFDPNVGTDNPGEAENYPVTPDVYKSETGRTVSGKGRIYFRVGLNGENPNAGTNGKQQPRYATITVSYKTGSSSSNYWINDKIYVRQGENPDYIYGPAETVGTHSGVAASYQPLAGSARGAAAARFSPYNLTAPAFKTGGDDTYYQVGINGGDFVNYPSQGGAIFQWALDIDAPNRVVWYDNNAWSVDWDFSKYWRAAYNPSQTPNGHVISWGNWVNQTTSLAASYPIMWNPDAGDPDYTNNYSQVFESCPAGYRRPTDGPTNVRSYNGPYPTPANGSSINYGSFVKQSEFRVSLFKYPFSGDANEVSDIDNVNGTWQAPYDQGTYPSNQGRSALDGTANGFYSDGFFDRRPIKVITNFGNYSGYAVSMDNANAAFPGVLFFNETSKASVFFPATGRINNNWPIWEYKGMTGYYWSSSAGPPYIEEKYAGRQISNGAWILETEYYGLVLKNIYPDYGMAIRCVKD